MSAVIAVSPLLQFTNSSGAPLVGGILYTYLAGTTTPSSTWQDDAQVALNTNPIVLDARGECRIWLDPALTYRLVLYDALGALIWSVDNVSGALIAGALANSLNVALGDALVGVKQPFTGAVATTQHAFNARQLWLDDFAPASGNDWAPSLTSAFAAAQALGGARILVSPGSRDLGSVVYMQGDNTTLEGANPRACIFNVIHDGALALGIKKLTAPGALLNCALRNFTLAYNSATAPNPSTIDMVQAEFVTGLQIENVTVEKGGVMCRLMGCSDVDLHRFNWNATDAKAGTNRRGIILTNTTATYTAGDKWGKRINVRNCKMLTTTGGAYNIDVAAIEIVCGEDVTINNQCTFQGARRGVLFAATAVGALVTRRVLIENCRDSLGARFVDFTGGTHQLQEIRILGCRTDTQIAVASGACNIDGLWIEGNFMPGYASDPIAINTGTLARVHVRRNTLTPVGAGAGGILLAGVTDYEVMGNILRATGAGGATIGIGLSGACIEGAVLGNTVVGYGTGVSLATTVTRTTVLGNDLNCTTPIANASTSNTNAIQDAPLAFSAYRATSKQTIAATTATKVLFNAEEYDLYGVFDSGANSRFTPGVAGTYTITAQISVTTPAAAGTLYCVLYKNGAEFKRGLMQVTPATAGLYGTNLACDVVAAAGDYFEIFFVNTAAGNKDIEFGANYTFFQACIRH